MLGDVQGRTLLAMSFRNHSTVGLQTIMHQSHELPGTFLERKNPDPFVHSYMAFGFHRKKCTEHAWVAQGRKLLYEVIIYYVLRYGTFYWILYYSVLCFSVRLLIHCIIFDHAFASYLAQASRQCILVTIRPGLGISGQKLWILCFRVLGLGFRVYGIGTWFLLSDVI